MKKSLLKKSLFLLCASVPLWFKTAVAVDHNNLDAGRPLEFDDASSIAFREQSLEFGASVSKSKSGGANLEGSAEYLYGFAKNSHFSLDFDPRFAREENGKRHFDSGNIGLGVFHNFNREYGSTPALALRADAYLPTGRNSSGVDFRLRAIATKHIFARSQLHLNFDLNMNNGAHENQRQTQPGILLGYSQPLGYPSRFDRTFVAQIGYRANELRGENGVTTVGVGLRQQVGNQSVVDVGVLSDLTGGSSREQIKVVAGYSRQF